MNETALGCCNTKAAEPTIGSQLIEKARLIAKHAEAMAQEAEGRLAAISRMPEPKPGIEGGEAKLQRAWPPYFDELRAILDDISRSIIAANNAVKRVEL